MDPVQFQLEGADGQLHDYEVTPHKTSEGTELMLRVLALAAEPLGRLLDASLKRGDISMDDDLGETLRGLDLSQIGGDVKAALLSLDAETLKQFFSRVKRDDKVLRLGTAYDDAYQGNWTEWVQALKEIVQANGFVPFLHMLANS